MKKGIQIAVYLAATVILAAAVSPAGAIGSGKSEILDHVARVSAELEQMDISVDSYDTQKELNDLYNGEGDLSGSAPVVYFESRRTSAIAAADKALAAATVSALPEKTNRSSADEFIVPAIEEDGGADEEIPNVNAEEEKGDDKPAEKAKDEAPAVDAGEALLDGRVLLLILLIIICL